MNSQTNEQERIKPEPGWGGPRVFFDFAIADRPIGRVVIELYPNICPKTCENFRQFCTGEYRPRGVPVGYKDTPIHRVIPGFIIQGGDCEKKNGEGIMSIYGFTFEDEKSAFSFNEAGIIGMANTGPDSNGCQFFITLGNVADTLDNHYVAFGKVISGIYTIRQIESVPLKPNTESPTLRVSIEQCGEL
ncbi:peptidylprolyl isomerase [Tritrichomonas foetus]|uniref:Peptidyl-prolyl cis-trans isomerase n=1 Tax=Tritrichomonas foetus TaxID=1144522 RepID=A0A1J4KJH0_9EUKA|nr:peptidylprolyl isomerase [Tritrichomonas foetus]|eukprot:OHT11088.1 peptidylprolyl isomerase [Tritrichomonas foetus]